LVKNSSGFILKVWIGSELSYAEFQKKAPKLKRLGNGYVKAVRNLLQSDEKHSVKVSSGFPVTVDVRIMRFCPNCNSEVNAAFEECPYCGREFK